MYKVFVYGTLKIGEPNHSLLAEGCKGYAQFLGSACTKEKFPLVIGTKFNIPFLLYAPGKGNIVKGEIYEVDKITLDQLDELEGHPDYYVREINKFTLYKSDGTETEIDSWVYFLKNIPEAALQKTYYTDYKSNGDHNLPYVERSKRDPYCYSSKRDMINDIK